jgi:hypothetical protein
MMDNKHIVIATQVAIEIVDHVPVSLATQVLHL